MKRIYNEVTRTVEHNFDEWVLVDVPNSIDHEDEEAVENYIDESRVKQENQGIVGDRDVLESLRLILGVVVPPLTENQINEIIDSMFDAMSNNYGA